MLQLYMVGRDGGPAYIYILIPYWVALSVCLSAIETTFPLSNFKTKHIFGILMALRMI